jgi:hypothetical protein
MNQKPQSSPEPGRADETDAHARAQAASDRADEAEREADEQLDRAREVAARAGVEDLPDAGKRSQEEQRERLSTRRHGHDESGD